MVLQSNKGMDGRIDPGDHLLVSKIRALGGSVFTSKNGISTRER